MKTSANVASTAAIIFGLVAILVCFIGVPLIVQKVTKIQDTLRADMDEFTITADDVWKEILITRNMVPKQRKTRQADKCRKLLLKFSLKTT